MTKKLSALILTLMLMGLFNGRAEARCVWVDVYDIYGNVQSKRVCSQALDDPAWGLSSVPGPGVRFIRKNPFTEGYWAESERLMRQREADDLHALRQIEIQRLQRKFLDEIEGLGSLKQSQSLTWKRHIMEELQQEQPLSAADLQHIADETRHLQEYEKTGVLRLLN